jgi:hypothetical protein
MDEAESFDMVEADSFDPIVNWTFLTNHGRALLCIGRDPGIRLREIAAALSITERRAQGIVGELTSAGYIVKLKDGRRNRYEIQTHKPLAEPMSQRRTIGEVLEFLAGVDWWDSSVERRIGDHRRASQRDRRGQRDRRSGTPDRRSGSPETAE